MSSLPMYFQSQQTINDDFEYDDDYNDNMYDYQNNGDDSEDTEEASEAEYNHDINNDHRNHGEPLEIKEQMYQDKLANLKKQLDELKHSTHPEYVRRVKKLESQYKERIRLNQIHKDYMIECVERDYILEKKATIKDFDEKKADLKENLLSDFEDKRKIIESERYTMELIGDSTEIKPTVTRKLRRRPNEPIPVAAEKRRKPPSGQLVLLLDEKEIENDLKIISRGKALTPIRTGGGAGGMNSNGIAGNLMGGNGGSMENNYAMSLVETKIEDGKLLYERRWFHRGQPVYVEGKDIVKFAATISAIGNEIIWVKKVNDNNKVKIHTTQLSRGKIAIKRRAN